jgi:hypothetical protein
MVTKKRPEPSAPALIVALYDAMVATQPEVARLGATMPYTALNGHMFSFVHPSGDVALRLPKELRPNFIEKYDSKLFDAYGLVQKEYVLVPGSLLERTDEVSPYFAASLAYVKSLKPKK